MAAFTVVVKFKAILDVTGLFIENKINRCWNRVRNIHNLLSEAALCM